MSLNIAQDCPCNLLTDKLCNRFPMVRLARLAMTPSWHWKFLKESYFAILLPISSISAWPQQPRRLQLSLPSLQGKPEQLCLEDWVQGKLLQLHLEGASWVSRAKSKGQTRFWTIFPLGKYLHDLVNKILVLKHGTMKSISICSVSSKVDNVDVEQGYFESILNVR